MGASPSVPGVLLLGVLGAAAAGAVTWRWGPVITRRLARVPMRVAMPLLVGAYFAAMAFHLAYARSGVLRERPGGWVLVPTLGGVFLLFAALQAMRGRNGQGPGPHR